MRTRAERRSNDWHKAIRKKKISDIYCGTVIDGEYVVHGWYRHLHQYSKNKIHCSCPLCRCKTNDLYMSGPAMNWPPRDTRQINDQMQQMEELCA